MTSDARILQDATGYELNESDPEQARERAIERYKEETGADSVETCVETDDLGCFVVVWRL